MISAASKIFFDKQDHKLLKIVNEVLDRRESFSNLNDLLYPYLHPHGIKELAESRGLRIAYAVIHLQESLEGDKRDERLRALRSLRDEVLNSADSHMRKNTARVLLQIMKELVYTRDDCVRQLELAHDFRAAVSGKPRIIRRLLRDHYLLEMPEEWNQVTFDGHVHDFYTKGRKSPAHLIMDAWIKGIRTLTVIYYNYAEPAPIIELLEASEIMDVDVRIGIELPTKFRNRYVQLIWIPRGFSDAQDFLTFLAESHVKAFMDEGRKISEYQRETVLAILAEFNVHDRLAINKIYSLDIPPLAPSDFLSFTGAAQASLLHLAKFIHTHMFQSMKRRVAELRESYDEAKSEEHNKINDLIEQMNLLDSEAIVDRFLKPISNRRKANANPPLDGSDIPGLAELSPFALIDRLNLLHSGRRIALNLSNLSVADVLELLYDCNGAISHLEIFNLKDFSDGKANEYKEINGLQRLINNGNVIGLIRFINSIIDRVNNMPGEDAADRKEKLKEIRQNVMALRAYYKNAPLKSSIGSDSSGHSHRYHGMGFGVTETLPHRVQGELRRSRKPQRLIIPVSIMPILRTVFMPASGFMMKILNRSFRFLTELPVFGQKRKEWEIQNHSTRIVSTGNVVSLGGVREAKGNGFHLFSPMAGTCRDSFCSWRHLNGILKNVIKVLIGFVPSVITFMYTQDWWFLIYFGTPIWFAITGLRNILQSVFGGGGIQRSPLLKWNSYVSWDRLSDSLLYTGLSVPLLEYFVKTLILDKTFGITITTDPIMLYAVMSIVNGVYISWHNLLRGLSKGAVIGNLFRSILNIPLSLGINVAIAAILGAFGVAAINDILQQWASIISKTSSDVVAGIIEGVADRWSYSRIRQKDYSDKLSQIFGTYEQLELMFPDRDVLRMLESSETFTFDEDSKASALEKIMIVNALDMLYLWMYQPRARDVCRSLFRKMSPDELQVLLRSQTILRRKKDITRMFVDGLVGRSFSRPLSFYLDCCSSYLKAIQEAAHKQRYGVGGSRRFKGRRSLWGTNKPGWGRRNINQGFERGAGMIDAPGFRRQGEGKLPIAAQSPEFSSPPEPAGQNECNLSFRGSTLER
jgi:hypothetical protein